MGNYISNINLASVFSTGCHTVDSNMITWKLEKYEQIIHSQFWCVFTINQNLDPAKKKRKKKTDHKTGYLPIQSLSKKKASSKSSAFVWPLRSWRGGAEEEDSSEWVCCCRCRCGLLCTFF
jgi:hypothetical protein